MSAGASGGDENDSDFEINLAPIIDCFTVLITYLLVSASFISLSALDVSVATASEEPPSAQPPGEPPTTLQVEMLATHEIKLVVGGPRSTIIPIPPTQKGDWNLEVTNQHIERIKKEAPALAELSVKADPTLKYKNIIHAVENLKKVMPKVFLGE